MDIGDIIMDYLKEHNLSAREFARKCGLSNTYISQIINGEKKNPSLDAFKSIAIKMGYSVQPLFDMVDDSQLFNVGNSENKNLLLTDRLEIDLVSGYRTAPEYIRDAINSLLGLQKEKALL